MTKISAQVLFQWNDLNVLFSANFADGFDRVQRIERLRFLRFFVFVTPWQNLSKQLSLNLLGCFHSTWPNETLCHRSFTSRIEFRFLGDFRFQSFPFLGGLRFRGVFGLRSSDIGLVTMFRRRVDQKEFSLPELLILTVTQSTQSE